MQVPFNRLLVARFLTVATILLLGGCAAAVRPDAPNGNGGGGGTGGGGNGIAVTIENKFSSVVPGSPTVTVNVKVVSDASGQGVTWSLSSGNGTKCDAPSCGTLVPGAAPSFSAAYTPPTVVPANGNASATIKATSVSDPSKMDEFTFTFSGSSPQLFQGNFVFLLRGFTGNGQPMAMAGSIVTDGKGNISDGELDINTQGQVNSIPRPLGGSYTIDTSFNGIIRGALSISGPAALANQPVVLRFVLSADGKRGGIIEADNSGFLNAGFFSAQGSQASGPTGSYVFSLDSDAPVGSRTVEIGQLQISANSPAKGVVDQSTQGAPQPTYFGTAVTGGTESTPDALGRGTLSVSVSGNETQYAYYVVDSAHFDLIEVDNGSTFKTVQSGVATLQTAIDANSVNTTSIVQMTGVGAATGSASGAPAVVIGRMIISGGSTLQMSFDGNNAGTIVTERSLSGTVTSFDPATGRGTISVTGGFGQGFVDTVVFYLSAAGAGVMIDGDPTGVDGAGNNVANMGYSGTLAPQIAGPFSNSNISGNVLCLSGASSSPVIPEIVAAMNFDSANQAFQGISDDNTLPSERGIITGVPFGGGFLVADTNTGHGNASFPSGFFGDFALGQGSPATFYVVGQNQFVMIGTMSSGQTGVSFFDPQ